MNADLGACFSDPCLKEMLVAEAILQRLTNGACVNPTDIRNSFAHDNPRKQIESSLERHGMR